MRWHEENSVLKETDEYEFKKIPDTEYYARKETNMPNKYFFLKAQTCNFQAV